MDGESTEGLHGVGSCASDEKPSDCNKLYIQIQLLISEQVQVAQGHFKKKQKTGDAGDWQWDCPAKRQVPVLFGETAASGWETERACWKFLKCSVF